MRHVVGVGLAVLALGGCGAASAPPRADPFADVGDPARERTATVAAIPAGVTPTRAVATELGRVMRRRIATGAATGPLLGVDCEPRSTEADGTPVIDCLAVRVRGSARIAIRIGTSFLARIDTRTRRFAWCDFQPVGGEGATESTSAYRAPARACGGGGALPAG